MDGIKRAKPTLEVITRGGLWSFAAGLVVSAVAAAISVTTFGLANTGVAEASTARPTPIVSEGSQLSKEWVWDLQSRRFDYMWRIPR